MGSRPPAGRASMILNWQLVGTTRVRGQPRAREEHRVVRLGSLASAGDYQHVEIDQATLLVLGASVDAFRPDPLDEQEETGVGHRTTVDGRSGSCAATLCGFDAPEVARPMPFASLATASTNVLSSERRGPSANSVFIASTSLARKWSRGALRSCPAGHCDNSFSSLPARSRLTRACRATRRSGRLSMNLRRLGRDQRM